MSEKPDWLRGIYFLGEAPEDAVEDAVEGVGEGEKGAVSRTIREARELSRRDRAIRLQLRELEKIFIPSS